MIDDEKPICELIKALLEPEGFKIFMAHNGADGMKVLKTIIPDLIILDMNMPKMGGIEFYSWIAKPDSTPGIPVLVLTGRGNMQSMFESMKVDGFMAKPFHAIDLIQKVKLILAQRSSQDQARQ